MTAHKAKHLALLLLLIASCSSAFADLAEITNAAQRSADRSRQALVMIFGDVVNNPLALGAGGEDTVLASIFQVFNGGLLVVGGIAACFAMFLKLSKTAHDGSVFDKERGSMWGPIRLMWGLISLVPTANGWSLSQLLMLWGASIMGVGTANLAVDASVAAFSNGASMVVQPVMPSTATLARSVFEINLCMHSINSGLAQSQASGAFEDLGGYIQQAATTSGFVLKNTSFICGGADINADLEAQDQSTGWFSGTIDTADLRRAHLQALQQMQQALDPAAKDFVDSYVQSRVSGGQLPAAELSIQAAARQYEATINTLAATKQGNIAALAAQLSASMQEAGWFTLGAWYQTFAQANTKLSDAVAAKASVFGMSPEGDPAMLAVYQGTSVAYKAQQSALTYTGPLGTTAAGNFAKGASATDSNSIIGSLFKAPGQRIITYMTDINAGGGARGQINPLIKMKNLGDYTLAAVETALTTYTLARALSDDKKDSWSVPGVMNPVKKVINAVGDSLKGAMNVMGPFLIPAIGALFALGAVLSIYIPMIPFIIWFGAAINWLVVVGEAVIAAPLWAFAFLVSMGEGMGHKTTHGWIFLLNVMTRPSLMVVGFFLGGAVMVVGGTFLNLLFGIALANAQFDSMTGLIGIIVYLGLYALMAINLVHRSFNLIFIVPDQVINWVGGHASATLGRDDNDQMRSSMNILTTKLAPTSTRSFGESKSGGGSSRDGIKG